MKNSVVALLMLGLFVAGFFVGKSLVPKPEEKIITKWERWPYPVEVIIEKEKLVPIHVDPPDPEIIEKYKDVDSLAIIQAFLAKNHYDLDFSQDSLGTYIAHVDVQANQVVAASATIQPMMKIIEKTSYIERPKRFIGGFATIGSSVNFQTAKVSAGAEFRERWIVGASGIKMSDQWGYTIDFGIKF